MKTFAGFLIGFLAMMCGPDSMKAQDVYIAVPINTIFDRSEFNTVKDVLYTNSVSWKAVLGLLLPVHPTIRSQTSLNYKHTTVTQATLRQEVLHWQLATIGGETPSQFDPLGTVPPYRYFTTSSQTWFQPTILLSGHPTGAAAFSFKIPISEYAANAFISGDYSRGLTHNYGSGSRRFTPASFNMIIRIPAAISWLSNTPTKYIEITDLNDYRSASTHTLGNLGAAEIAHTVDFNLYSKAASSNIQFTSSKGVTGTRAISLIQLGSADPKLMTSPLSANWQNYSSSLFEVKTGNRNNFTLELSVSAADFKNYFYQAGTYNFQLNLDAKSSDGTVSDFQNTDVTIQVFPLSEIGITPSSQTVNFEFNTPAHYSQGQSKVISNQIKLSNNENFELYVKSGTNYFKKAGIQSDVNSNTLQVGIDGSSMVSLTTTPQKIISNGSPVLDQELDIKYTIPASKAQALVSKDKTTYSIDVIYSFTAL